MLNRSDTSESATRSSNGGFLSYLGSLLRIASKIHYELPALRRYKKTTQFCFNGVRYRQEFKALQGTFDCPELSQVIHWCPAIFEKPFSPYVQTDWDSGQRYEQIRNHFGLLKQLFGENSAQIYKPQGYQLFEFNCHENERYTVELFPGYQNEGSIGIRLCDDQKREVYTLSLHLAGGQEKSCYIGALQGPNDRIPDRQKVIVSLTRGLHGLRPKALMIEALYMVAGSLEISSIYGISNAGNIYNASVYRDKKVEASRFDRDQMWREYRAESISECLFEFPQEPARKDIALLKPNKRSMYRKRYAWLSHAARQTDDAIYQLLLNGANEENRCDGRRIA